MPLIEIKCKSCDTVEEVLVKNTGDVSSIICKVCGAEDIVKISSWNTQIDMSKLKAFVEDIH